MERIAASLTPKEAAEILGCSVYTVHELLREGRLKGFKITSHWRIPAEELERFMQSDQETTTIEEDVQCRKEELES